MPANSVAVIDPQTNTVVGSGPVGSRPGPIVFGAESLWVANLDDQTVSRIDPGSLQTLRVLALPDPPTGLAAGAGAIWVAQSNPQASTVSVNAIDPQFDALGADRAVREPRARRLGLGRSPGQRGLGRSVLGSASRVDSAGRVLQRIDPNSGPAAITLGDGATWLVDTEGDNVIRVDATGVLTPIAVGNGPTAIAVGDGGVWVVDSLDDAVVRIDPATLSVTDTISVGTLADRSRCRRRLDLDRRQRRRHHHPDRPAHQEGSGDGGGRRQPAGNHGRRRAGVGDRRRADDQADRRSPPAAARCGWNPNRTLIRRIRCSALAYGGLSWQLLYVTCAKLLNYPDKAGPAGARLIPEVAQALPPRSPDGKTYTFTIRPGFRFSPPSNQPVTAQTFKDTIERSLDPRMHSAPAPTISPTSSAPAPTWPGKPLTSPASSPRGTR